jgi:oxaloacetate decarboxylase (Na+ extruding) subunit gamma
MLPGRCRMNFSLLDQGLVLMLTGMGTVFVFLSALVLAMNLLARLVLLLPQPSVPAASGISHEEVAAVSAAIHLHRRRT